MLTKKFFPLIFNYYIVALILLITSFFKFNLVYGNDKLWYIRDPLFPFFKSGNILIIMALIEILLAGYILLYRNKKTSALSLIAISIFFTLYHIGLTVIGHKGGCLCLGTLVSVIDVYRGFRINPNIISIIFILYFAITGYLKLHSFNDKIGRMETVTGDSGKLRIRTVR